MNIITRNIEAQTDEKRNLIEAFNQLYELAIGIASYGDNEYYSKKAMSVETYTDLPQNMLATSVVADVQAARRVLNDINILFTGKPYQPDYKGKDI